MISNYAQLPDVIIPNGTNVSQVFNAPYVYADAIGIILFGTDPGGYPEVYTLEVNEDQGATNASTGWVTLQGGNPPADLAPPAALKSRVYQELVFSGSWRIKANGNVAASRTWRANKVWTT